MADPLALALNLPFQEQIDFFRAKLNLPTERWDDIKKGAHDRAFVVAGAMKADLLEDLRGAVSPLQRTTLEAFRRDFKRIVAQHGWHGWTGEGTKGGEAWRTKVIFETNVRASHAAGRYRQLTDPDTLAAMPYWRYVHNDSVMHPRPHHQAWHGLTLPAKHEFWQTHFAPNGWGCRCKIVAQSQPGTGDKARPPEGWDALDPKTGEQIGIDKGWGYAPGASNADALRQAMLAKAARLHPELGDALAASLATVRNPKPDLDFNGQRPGLADLPPVPVTVLTGEEFGAGLSKAQLAKAADDLLRAMQARNGLANNDTGWLLRVNKAGRKKMGDNADQTVAESRAVAGIESLSRHAVVAESHLDDAHHNPDVRAVYRFYAPLLIGSDLYRVKLTVKDYLGAKEKRQLHALEAVEIESAPLGIFPSYSNAEAFQTGQPTTGRALSISDLLDGATMNDGNPYRLPK